MGNRDGWCTPLFITKRLPEVDLDPCSNARSSVKSKRVCDLRYGMDGTKTPWEGLSIFCNPPWSDPLPFAMKAWEALSFCFLVKEDPTTEWWDHLTAFPCFRFSFLMRVGFVAPPGVDSSTNEHPTCLITCPMFREMLGTKFDGLGRWWSRQ